MIDKKIDKLISLLEPLEKDSIGEWIIDKEHKGTKDDPKHIPYLMFTEMVNELINAVYEFDNENPEFELKKYKELLKERNIEWEQQSIDRKSVV